jgi:hypothetical protein
VLCVGKFGMHDISMARFLTSLSVSDFLQCPHYWGFLYIINYILFRSPEICLPTHDG